MPTFEEALKGALQGLDQGFRSAEADLWKEVAAASEGVAKLTNQVAKLDMRKSLEVPTGTYYDLRMLFSKRFFDVGSFFIPARGYPI